MQAAIATSPQGIKRLVLGKGYVGKWLKGAGGKGAKPYYNVKKWVLAHF